MLLHAAAVSETGPVRKTNEDSFMCDEGLRLFAVADGMGGHHAGEVASRLAIEAITGFLVRSADEQEVSWPCGIDPKLSYDGNRVRTAIYLANRRVFRAAESFDDYTGMGTTVVAALVVGAKAIVGHVGDSRLYIFRAGELRQVTADDSWAATVLAHRPEERGPAADHPMRHVLTNVLGARDHTEIHMTELSLQGGELLLLCSDGLHGAVADADLATVLCKGGDVQQVVRRLVDTALQNGSRDNVTALVVACENQ